MKIKSIRAVSVMTAAALVVSFGLVPAVGAASKKADTTQKVPLNSRLPEGQARVMIPVKGMTCAACTSSIKLALKRLEGVISVDVDYLKGAATVVHDKNKVTVKQMVTTINKTGFEASLPQKS